ncbi:PEP-CTERM sorting domain-containing protein [Rheinheimera sp. D18]|uniref:PEP-CTERM sorting domain-containing protein n=1 Tax=Rheinheimera sp. D18 TaxID=2545632 RepID=UPI00104DC901|nr:PEP-CTERM sorting domain-containing protein [Rheinheimera sp. D18]QBL10796.1 PEP-CTERM sorting domain-containing protein [Rheinheimera sp. D18]
MKRILSIALVVACGLAGRANASLIDANSYFSDTANSMYWSAFNLDIMRLSWSDTLGQNNVQASEADVNQFVANSADGWRWATLSEFVMLHQFFDTDATADGWSLAQNIGSELFFSLNGTGPVLTEQNGYDFEGYTYWQFGTLFDNEMHYAWMADFATNLPGVTCASYSELCYSGYFTDSNSPLFTANNVLHMPNHNIAPLLVRTNQPKTDGADNLIAVPAPASLWLLALGVMGIATRRRTTK